MDRIMQADSENLNNPMFAVAISPGIVVGTIRLFKAIPTQIDNNILSTNQLEAELVKLQTALEKASTELNHMSKQVAQTIGPKEAAIFEAQQLMLKDPDLLSEIKALITKQHFSSANAVKQASEYHIQHLEALENKTLATRATDLRDVASRVIRILLHDTADGFENKKKAEIGKSVVVVAHELTPSDIVDLATQSVTGIVTVLGGPTTHTAILARALEIPTIAGIDPHLLSLLQSEQEIAIDGSKGLFYLQPDTQQKQELHNEMLQQQKNLLQKKWYKHLGATADGTRVQIYANVSDITTVQNAITFGAEGIGLLRTEFLFNNRLDFPNEQAQFESYLSLFEAFAKANSANQTAIIVARTLDIGADKPFPALERLYKNQAGTNPALGIRGVRMHLLHQGLLRQQLRALLRAAGLAQVELHLMFPMISTLEEVRKLKEIYQEVQHELGEEKITLPKHTQLGIMIETPAAALMTEVIAREVDFLSIGANDLYQYTMAVDRNNNQVAAMFGKLEPAVWRLINQIVQAGLQYKKHVAVCGELAADPKLGALLVGLGVQELSISPNAIPSIKASLHEHTLEYWQEKANELLKAETATEIQAFLTVL
jgi:phosphoenolpyruvate-protein phosphotransferase